MNIQKEIQFEDEICEHLAANGWLYSKMDAADYNRQLAQFPADVLAWVQETQPDAWETVNKNHGDAASQTLLNRLRDSINQSGNGRPARTENERRLCPPICPLKSFRRRQIRSF